MALSTSVWSLLVASIASYVCGSTVTRLQSSTLPVCGQNSVCAEISQLPPFTAGDNYIRREFCICPRGHTCPKAPGKQTVDLGSNTWYGFCQPTSDVDECEEGDVAAERFVTFVDGRPRTYTKVHCSCSGRSASIQDATSSMGPWKRNGNDARATAVYELLCGGQSEGLKKRGERFGSRPGHRRFYFY